MGGQGWEKGCTERSQDWRLLGMAFVRTGMVQGKWCFGSSMGCIAGDEVMIKRLDDLCGPRVSRA